MGRWFRRLWGESTAIPGGTVASSTSGALALQRRTGFRGQAIASASEIRFVAAIVDANNVQLNAPFTITPAMARQ